MRRLAMYLALRAELGQPVTLSTHNSRHSHVMGVVRRVGWSLVDVELSNGTRLLIGVADVQSLGRGPMVRVTFLQHQLDDGRRATELGDKIAASIADQSPADLPPEPHNVASFPPRLRPVPTGPDLPPGAA